MRQETINNIIIESCGVKIGVESEDKKILSKIFDNDFVVAHIPSCKIYKNSGKKIFPLVKFKRSERFRVDICYPSIICYQPEKSDIKGLIALIEYALERARNEKGIYTIHSSCIVKNGLAVVIFGGTTNLGKTIVAKTCADNFGWSLYADEKTLINSKGDAVGGVSVASNCDEFADFKFFSGHKSAKIISFIHPHIDNGLNKNKIWDKQKFFWHLNEELARKIRGCSKVINFFKYPLPSIDTDKIAVKRTQFAKKISAKIPCYEIRGTPQKIARTINKINQ